MDHAVTADVGGCAAANDTEPAAGAHSASTEDPLAEVAGFLPAFTVVDLPEFEDEDYDLDDHAVVFEDQGAAPEPSDDEVEMGEMPLDDFLHDLASDSVAEPGKAAVQAEQGSPPEPLQQLAAVEDIPAKTNKKKEKKNKTQSDFLSTASTSGQKKRAAKAKAKATRITKPTTRKAKPTPKAPAEAEAADGISQPATGPDDARRRKKKKESKRREAQVEQETAQLTDRSSTGTKRTLVEERPRVQDDARVFDEKRADETPMTPAMERKMVKQRVERILVDNGGSYSLTSLEQDIRQQLPNEVLAAFRLDADTISLTGVDESRLVEGPSYSRAAKEMAYFEIGQALLEAGLDRKKDARFLALLEDLMGKRQELLAMAAASEAKHERRLEDWDLPGMSYAEKKLYDAVVRACKALQKTSAAKWASLSKILDDSQVRAYRSRCTFPRGLRFWQWLSCRAEDNLQLATNHEELLVAYTERSPDVKAPAKHGEELRKAPIMRRVLEVLSESARLFPRLEGMKVSELNSTPEVAGFKVTVDALRGLLQRLPDVFITKEGVHGWTVQLAGTPGQAAAALGGYTIPNVSVQFQEKARTLGDWEQEQDKFAAAGCCAVPPGWTRALSKTTGRVYYVNRNTGESQYDVPVAAASPVEVRD
eukprot:TRINITY_DN111080_c0_g1_i1.p1 TRINITY_DN111080_c0_g1~~TRINITY_DN111080_c0_g1_i1.p1  ORF type:complete len:650 (-),score=168.21 TRINITY_DN111080_c0_g1_i1:83-2032(-)